MARRKKVLPDVGERFWQMDNRFWIIDDPDFSVDVGTLVIGFMAKEELCCDSAELGLEHPSREIDHVVLADILNTHGSVVIWDLHTRDSLLMTRRVD